MKEKLCFLSLLFSLTAIAQQVPTCTITCPEDMTIQAPSGQDSATVNYTVDLNCEPVAGLCSVSYPGNDGGMLANSNYTRVANDFDLPEGGTYTITRIVPHFVRSSYGSDVFIYEDNYGIPGTQIASFANVQYVSQTEVSTMSDYPVYEVVIDLPAPLELTGGKYWVATNAQGPLIYWEATTNVTTRTSYTSINEGTTWTANAGYDGVFDVVYECGDAEDATLVLASGPQSGAQFPVGTTEVTHNLVYNDSIINSCSFSVTVSATSDTKEFEKDLFLVYPSPSTGILNITGENLISNVTMYDLAGREVYTSEIGKNSAVVNISNLSSGIYVVKLFSDKGNSSVKIVKK